MLTLDNYSLYSPGVKAVNACQIPPNRMQFDLQLYLAANPTQAVIETFFKAWISGDSVVLDSLAPDLRQAIPTVQALDRRVGIPRTPADRLDLTWRVVENTGSQLRLAVQAKVNGGQAILFQVVLSQAISRWQVSEANAGIIFPPSTDAVYWAGLNGAIYRYSLSDGKAQMVSSAGVYNPRPQGASQTNVMTPPEISPDGRWLALYPSGGDTLLVDQQNGKVIRLPQTGSLAWSQDGKRIAFAEKNNTGTIFILAAPFNAQPSVLTRLTEDPAVLAWSPDGSQVAVLAVTNPANLEATPTLNPTQGGTPEPAGTPLEQRDISVIDATSGNIRHLTTLECPTSLATNALDLAWTNDGQQIWYRSLGLAISVKDGSTFTLLTDLKWPWMVYVQDQGVQYSVLYPKVLGTQSKVGAPAVGEYLISPDGRWMTFNPIWLDRGFVTRISMRSTPSYSYTENWGVKMEAEIYSLAWTLDAQNSGCRGAGNATWSNLPVECFDR